MNRTVHIIAPPPTPNGDLHVGHMSGPYLGADLFARTLRQQGGRVNFVVSTDDHQSYVDTTARRLQTSPQALIAKSRAEIKASFDNYGIALSALGSIDGHYCRFVENFFGRLLSRDLIGVHETEVLFDNAHGRYAVEAFVSGLCRHCLASASGGICEACGHPNACVDLIGLDQTRFAVRREPRLVLDLERYRPGLERQLGAMSTHRPWLRRLIESLLSRPLMPFTLSYKTERGIDLGFAGLANQRLNVWGEMFPGHIHFLAQAGGGVAQDDCYIQFLGFDNSYFYVFVHLALALAAREAGYDWPLPEAFITNQFYNLRNEKFSTSKGHLVWARDLATDFNTDVIRLFLALHGPEYQEADFSNTAFAAEALRLLREINAAVSHYNEGVPGPNTDDTPGAAGLLLANTMRPETAIERYSASDNARRALNGIRSMAAGPMADQPGLSRLVPGLLALALEPLCPRYAARIREGAGLDQLRWDRLLPAPAGFVLPELGLHALKAGGQP